VTEGARWFSPAPSELSAARLSLDFGLRAADLWFRERVVPELGGVRFVRQLSWPVAALALHAEWKQTRGSAPRPSAICHGLEALACKLEYWHEPGEGPSDRVRGRRAFDRDFADDTNGEVWDFARLRRPTYYVRNTFRQTASRVLRVETGLGFVRGPRFDQFALEKVGEELADAFLDQPVGKGGGSLRKLLLTWLQDGLEPDRLTRSVREALSPDRPTAPECKVVRARLFEVGTAGCATRTHLAAAVGRAKEPPDLDTVVVENLRARGRDAQARDLRAARAFGAMLDRSLDVAARVTELVEASGAGIGVTALAQDKQMASRTKALRDAARRLGARAEEAGIVEPDSRAYAMAVVQAAEDAAVVARVVTAAGELFALADSTVARGPLFRVIAGAAEDDAASEVVRDEGTTTELTDRTFRVANLHALACDLDAGSKA